MITCFRHPRIFTGVSSAPWTSELYVDGERIVHVGAGGPTAQRTIDLTGEVVIPGLHDAHIHTGALACSLDEVDINAVPSLEEALVEIRAYAATRPPGSWILGGRWDSNRWAVPEQPTRWDLDQATGDHPAALETVDAHTIWLNSKALELCGITRNTPEPPGGQIVRDVHGEPTGIIREAWRLLDNAPGIDDGIDLDELLPKAQAQMLAFGLTSITDIDGEDVRRAYMTMRSHDELHLRVAKAVRLDEFDLALADGRRTGDGDAWLATGPLKLFSDGALGSHTCHMSSPIGDEPDNHGLAVLSVEDMANHANRAVQAGISVATHAIGDAAVHAVLDAYEHLQVPDGLRLRVEHAQHLQPKDVARMARMGVVASMQPTHCTSDYALVDSLLAGHDLVSYGWSSMLAAGVPLAFGSDAPVESANPFFALHAAVTRQDLAGEPAGGWQPEERITMAQAIVAHSLGSAHADGAESVKGSLEVGKVADLVAVDTDLFSAEILRDEPLALRTALPTMTVVGGEVRFAL